MVTPSVYLHTSSLTLTPARGKEIAAPYQAARYLSTSACPIDTLNR